MIRFISILSAGLFAGFTFFLAFILSPSTEFLSAKNYSELFLSFVAMARWGPRILHFVFFASTLLWLWQMRSQWKSISFVCLSIALLLVLQSFVLATLGHFRVADEIKYYLNTENLPPNWKKLRSEWGWFMVLHVATSTIAFMIALIPLLRTWQGSEVDPHHTPSCKPDDTTLTEVELHLKLRSRSNEPSASQDKTH